jgi:phosphate transport system permease protein
MMLALGGNTADTASTPIASKVNAHAGRGPAAGSFSGKGSMMTATSASIAASITLPGPMELRVDPRVQREPIPPAQRNAAAPWQDWLFERVTMLFAVLVLAMLLAIIGALSYAALPALQKFGFGFFFTNVWDPVKSQFGALAPIYGTLVTSAIALLIGVPVSFGIALFLTEMCPPILKRPLGTAVELLAAIPSIIYGMWGLFVFAPLFGDYVQPLLQKIFGNLWILGPLFKGAPNGIGMLSAGVILSVMIIPFISSVMRDVFEIVPPVLKESAYGIGCTTWEVVRNVVLPYTKVGVIGGIMLGLGRALGETMAVTFIIGNAYRISSSLYEPGNSIASALANEFNEAADPIHRASLITLGLVLFVLTLIVLSLSRLLIAQLAKGEGKRT